MLKNGQGPTVMYRADMDANAVEEATGLPYASKVRVRREDGSETPVAHMCGHDAHVTWMIGMAKAMVDDGLWIDSDLPKPDDYIAMHTTAGPVGVVVSSAGPKMAGTDQIDILFRGVGGHGSMPLVNDDALAARLAVPFNYLVVGVADPAVFAAARKAIPVGTKVATISMLELLADR